MTTSQFRHAPKPFPALVAALLVSPGLYAGIDSGNRLNTAFFGAIMLLLLGYALWQRFHRTREGQEPGSRTDGSGQGS